MWIGSFLSGRTVRLSFEGAESEPRPLQAGVPQGSPLSPILFILYIASLYEMLSKHRGLTVVGFADDTNLLTSSFDAAINVRQLEAAYRTCERWAVTRGMEFAPQKSELIHFTRAHKPVKHPIRLADAAVEPVEEARFLGVWLDRKLGWKAHLKRVKAKMATQQLALTKLAASAWGCSTRRAREIYTKVIRSAIAYGAAAWHQPAEAEEKPAGIAAGLGTVQSRLLRCVGGAYKATPTRQLETELFVPPIDLYLNKKVADFEGRVAASGLERLLSSARKEAAARLGAQFHGRRPLPARAGVPAQARRRRRALATGEERAEWARRWKAHEDQTNRKIIQDWEARWHREHAAAEQRGHRHAPADDPIFTKGALAVYLGLRKHESSLLMQLRTGKIGLRAFLFQRRVPDVNTPLCSCGTESETPAHIVLNCPLLAEQRERLRRSLAPLPLLSHRDFENALRDYNAAHAIVKWCLGIGRFPLYDLAVRIGGDVEELPKKRARGSRARRPSGAPAASTPHGHGNALPLPPP
jgi:hypothetical protein